MMLTKDSRGGSFAQQAHTWSHSMHRKLEETLASVRFAIKPVIILSVIFLVGMSAIILANFNYIDDILRVRYGETGWGNWSRYASSALAILLSTDEYITDLSPLTQIIAAIELAIAGVAMLYLFSGKKRFTAWMFISVIPLGLSPYFLECLSYKFDSPFMALSVLAAILPAIFAKKRIGYVVAAFLGTLMVCLTYQASLGIFPMLVIFVSLRRWCEGEAPKQIGRFVLESVIGYVVAIIFFRLFVMHPHTEVGYASTGIPSLATIIPSTLAHYQMYFATILQDFKPLWLVLIVLLFACFLYATIMRSRRNKTVTFLVAIIATAVAACMMFGIYPVLESPTSHPRAMIGSCVFITFLSTMVATAKGVPVGKFAAAVLSWCFFSFSFTYGNALYVQDEWTDFRTTFVLEDLNDIEAFANDEPKTVEIAGSIGYAPSIKSQINAGYTMLSRLVPVTLSGTGWPHGVTELQSSYGLKNVKFVYSGELDDHELPFIKDGIYQTIYGQGNEFIVALK